MILFLLKDKGREAGLQPRKSSPTPCMSPPHGGRLLKSLEREGYVEKLADETDQRRKAVRLTPRERPPSRGASRSLRRWTRACSRAFAPRRRGRPAAISCGCSTICGGIFHRKG